MNTRKLPSLSALRAFEAAARHLSAKRAAAELSVTPTAISHQVRQLEESLGLTLFVRKPRQLALTPQGRKLQQVLSESLDAIADTITQLRETPERQSITLSATPAVALRWLLPWVCLLRDAHPKLDLSIHTSHEDAALDGVVADMAIRYGDGNWPGMVAEKLFENVFAPVCSPSLGLTEPSQLPHHTLLHFEPCKTIRSPGDWYNWQHQTQVPGLDVGAGLTFSDETHVISAALDGQGVALMSIALMMDELRTGRLIRPFGPDLIGKSFYLIYPQRRAHEPAIMAVHEWVIGLRERYSTLQQAVPGSGLSLQA
ncbi:LysR substrate-binding domain-containing protein [Nitrincola sp. MINF-07-Sa-05]|uniref:LysR substrate-binding domain-containing protein n=1 Tax=Nitrincola salilacus TaxID=3400273 RepID=UPI0039180AF2